MGVAAHPNGSPDRGHLNQKFTLKSWVEQAIGLAQVRVHVKVQGNHFHILCESDPCPVTEAILPNLVRALAEVRWQDWLPADHSAIYQVSVYGRLLSMSRPEWSEVIYLNQLERYQERWLPRVETPQHRLEPSRGGADAALVVSNYSLAQQGKPGAIAHYLSEILSLMGVAVQVSVKTVPWKGNRGQSSALSDGATALAHPANQRLWITCESVYSPDPSLLAEPIAQRLRELKLEGFRDALVFSQVKGETRPDWILRVDLTPPEAMLREWARWGDVPAIARLLNSALKEQTIQASVSLKEATLHIICTSNQQGSSVQQGAAEVAKQSTVEIVAPLLHQVAPQGIQAATVYGFKHWRPDGLMPIEPPLWVDWLELPAQIHPALAASTLTLAQQGDRDAILFLLTRLLNPDLDTQLATGGIRVQLLQKGDLLHIMTDAPICPDQRQIGMAIIRCLRPLKIPHIHGIRIYGRRSGQKRPLWSYGTDFNRRQRIVPEATPEFAASEAYIGDLLAKPGELALRSELAIEDLPTLVVRWRQQATQFLQQFLLRTQLFELEATLRPATTSQSESTAHPNQTQNLRLALVWGAVGVLLAVNVDWILGLALKSLPTVPPPGMVAAIAPKKLPAPVALSPVPTTSVKLPHLSLKKSVDDKAVFNASGFTGSEARSVVLETENPANPSAHSNAAPPESAIPLPASPIQPMSTVLSSLARSGKTVPTFNSRQLDEKLALYREQVAETGPPDILIIGSSRALRGVDPIALEKALAAQGYPGVKVFNFGINGATAQVVNLILQEFLTPQQLPKLILWADGARAFNSGRVDITYNGIKVSDGYKQLTQSKATASPIDPAPVTEATPVPPTAVGELPAPNPVAAKNWLEQFFSQVSVSYPQRDRLKTFLRDKLAAMLPGAAPALPPPTILTPNPTEQVTITRSGAVAPPSLPSEGQGLIDINGFLALSNRFNPATYYQKYARVSGDYDGDYEAFHLTGKQVTALNQLTAFTQSKQIPLVFVNLPLTEAYLDPIRREYENEFQQGIYSLSAAKKFAYIDLGQIWLSENDYFSDPSHLNRYGAYAVSQRLAQNVLIPWQAVKALSPTAPITEAKPSP
jgi:hypothetical protein